MGNTTSPQPPPAIEGRASGALLQREHTSQERPKPIARGASRSQDDLLNSEERTGRIGQPREAAIRTYLAWLKAPMRIDTAAERELKRAYWDPRDAHLMMEILYGVVRQHGRLAWLIRQLKAGKEQPDPAAIACVAVGLYQLLYLDRVPEYAVVDASAVVAKKLRGPALTAWVNAILRRAARERNELRSMFPSDPRMPLYERLAIQYSHPAWMVSRWLERLPKSKVEHFLGWNNRRPALALRVNRIVATSDDVRESLAIEGHETTAFAPDPYFLLLRQGGNPAGFEAIRTGRASIQDPSQGLVARLVAANPEEKVLDLCAAPGGKTGHLAELYPSSRITATDRAEERLTMLRSLVARNSYKNVEVQSYEQAISSRQRFDVILVDAPCSGTGVLSRRPDLRWRRSPDDIRRMAAVQLSLLNYATDRLKPAGRIIYSTCSIEPEENDLLIARVLADRRDLMEASVGEDALPGVPLHNGRLELMGPELGTDGVFAAVLIKRVTK